MASRRRISLADSRISPFSPCCRSPFSPAALPVVVWSAGGGEVGGGEHGQGDVGVPGPVVADLVLVEPGLVLGRLEAFLDRPPGPGDPDQLPQRGRGGSGAAVERQLPMLSCRAGFGLAAHQQPVPPPRGQPGRVERDGDPVVLAQAVRAGPDRAAFPPGGAVAVAGQHGQGLGLAAVPVRAGEHVVVAGGQHERHLVCGQPVAEAGVLAVDLVRGDPPGQHSGGMGALEHRHPELRFGREPDLVGDPGSRAARPVFGPRGRQIELAVDQRPPMDRGVGQEHPDLAVVDLPGGAGVLPLHPGRAHALLDEPGLVDDEHPARLVAELGPAHSRAGHHAHRRCPSPRCAAAAASRPATPPRHARPPSSRSCAPSPPADPAGSPRPAAAAPPAGTAPRSAPPARPTRQPTRQDRPRGDHHRPTGISIPRHAATAVAV